MSLLVNPIPRRQPIRRGLGLLGDSFSGNCHTIAATAFGTEAYGYAGMIAARTGLFPSYLDNQGKLGDHTGQFLARLPACIASSTADLWLLLSRTDDSTTAGMSLADTKANVMKIVTAFLNTPGKYLIVGTGTPRFGSRALTGQALADAIAYKDWVLSYVSQFVPVVNIWDGFTEAMTVEGLHPNILGADFISSRVVPIIAANFEFPGIPLPTDAGDIYSAIRLPQCQSSAGGHWRHAPGCRECRGWLGAGGRLQGRGLRPERHYHPLVQGTCRVWRGAVHRAGRQHGGGGRLHLHATHGQRGTDQPGGRRCYRNGVGG
ncbi:Prophage PssSM-02, GDSL-like lipase [Pseudomonas coronafaciens pv. porri]|uniref:SGNH/GDSL hydrolase family protein n=1 Tax=Pseudomonas syringae group TaxID=136849 RepID=UPI000B08FCA9|nr:SGNH/GDSL hydrolase family protein [Pseudomonas coronafaciens]RMU84550.1 Prophage PssSM-02, GDSL-like lipase [Pseudomonas coronafaciens pv. porri]